MNIRMIGRKLVRLFIVLLGVVVVVCVYVLEINM